MQACEQDWFLLHAFSPRQRRLLPNRKQRAYGALRQDCFFLHLSQPLSNLRPSPTTHFPYRRWGASLMSPSFSFFQFRFSLANHAKSCDSPMCLTFTRRSPQSCSLPLSPFFFLFLSPALFSTLMTAPPTHATTDMTDSNACRTGYCHCLNEGRPPPHSSPHPFVAPSPP